MRTRTHRRQAEYSTTALDEQEVTIRLDRATGQAYITSCWPTWSRRLTRLYGEPHRITTDPDGHVTASWWVVPIGQITFRRLGTRKPGNPQNLARARTAPPRGDSSRESRETAED